MCLCFALVSNSYLKSKVNCYIVLESYSGQTVYITLIFYWCCVICKYYLNFRCFLTLKDEIAD